MLPGIIGGMAPSIPGEDAWLRHWNTQNPALDSCSGEFTGPSVNHPNGRAAPAASNFEFGASYEMGSFHLRC